MIPSFPAGVQDAQLTLHAAPSSQSPAPPVVGANAAVTLTANTNGPALDLGSQRAPGELGMPMAAVIQTTALNLTTGDETYTFTLQDSPDSSTWTTRGTVGVTAVGSVAVGGLIKQEYVRLNLAVAGTSPSITYQAFLNPNVRTQI